MRDCKCVNRHVPTPLRTAERATPRGVVWLCPVADDNLNLLLEIYEKRAGSVPGSMTKHFGKYIRDLAESIYNER